MRRNAFTLVELILALLIASIVGLTITHVFWSGLKLDDQLRQAQDKDLEVLMINQMLSRDIENALALDYTSVDPEMISFEGNAGKMSFFTQTATGIKRVRYYIGMGDNSGVSNTLIRNTLNMHGRPLPFPVPIAFIFRQEMTLAQWAVFPKEAPAPQIVAAGVKTDSFKCMYAKSPATRSMEEINNLEYTLVWNQKPLPVAVKCQWDMYDPQRPMLENQYQRQIFLAPVNGQDHG